MAHSGNNGDLRFVDGIGHPLIIEGPQVFQRAAAPAYDQQVCQTVGVGIADGSGDFLRGFRALDTHRQELHLGERIALAQNAQNIVDCRTGRAGDNADGARVFGQLLFFLRVKQALGCQLGFQLLEGGIQVPHAVHAHGAAIQLISAVPWVDGDPAQSDDLHAVGRPEAQPHGIALEHDALQCRSFILQCKIVVPRGVTLVVADLAPDRHLGQERVSVHFSLNVFVNLGN